MSISRREAIAFSGSALAGLSVGGIDASGLSAQVAQPEQEWPDRLVEAEMREGFPVPLPLNPDGSAPEHDPGEAGPITPPLMWRSRPRVTPDVEADYRRMAIKLNSRGFSRLEGTLRFTDLEQLPRVTHTFLMQCGAPNPRGIVKWTGVRYADFVDMIGLIEGAHYCRFIAADGHYVDEAVSTLRHPQVMLAWMMNDEPITPDHGAPLRLVIPFRYGNRSVKAITEILFGTPSLPAPPTTG